MKNHFAFYYIPAEVNSKGAKLFYNKIKIAKLFLRSLAKYLLCYKKSLEVIVRKNFAE